MVTATRPLSVSRFDSPEAWWEFVSTPIEPRLRDYVVSWCGFREWSAGPSRRREVPAGIVPLIIDFTSAYRVAEPPSRLVAPQWQSYRFGFAAGMHESCALTESIGLAEAMQVNFTPIGAYLFFGRPMSDLTNRLATLGDLFGTLGPRLVDQLQDAPDWDARFDLLEAFIMRRFADARAAAAPSVIWAWRELTRTAGQIEIGGLATALGCSRKHLIAQFHQQIGAPPKTIARILRFDHAVRLFKTGSMSGADVALTAGYFDQAHCIREFRQFAGVTPSEFLRQVIPELDAVSACERTAASAAP